MIAMFDFAGNISHNLDSTAARSNNRHPLALQRISLFIRCRMQQLALEVTNPRNVGPFPIIQDTARIYEKLGTVVCSLTGLEIIDFQAPDSSFIVPDRAVNAVAQFDVFVDKVVVLFDVLEIAPDIRGVGVVTCPGTDTPGDKISFGSLAWERKWLRTMRIDN